MDQYVSTVLEQERESELLEFGEESQAEVAIFELVERVGSGFIREGTEKMAEPDEINYPGWRQIPTKSAYREGTLNAKGVEVGPWKRIPIRFRSDSDLIIPKEQDEAGSEASSENDRILFKNGRLVVVDEGRTKGMFAHMRKDSYNVTNPNRIPGSAEIYREIFPEKENEYDIEGVFAKNNAITYIEGLIIDRTPGAFKYDEYRLEALAQYHGIVADSPSGKIKALVATAELNPAKFLSNSRQFEEKTLTDILHAEKLGVIKFDTNRVIYVEKGTPIHSYSDKLTKDQRYRQLAGYFQSFEGKNKNVEFQIELSNAKKALDGKDGAK